MPQLHLACPVARRALFFGASAGAASACGFAAALLLAARPFAAGFFAACSLRACGDMDFLCFYVDKFLDNSDNLDICWTSFQTIGGPILVQFWTRSAQAEAKMGPRGPSRASKTQRGAFAQIQKTFSLWRFWGPRRPKTASESPKWTPKMRQKGSKTTRKRHPKMDPIYTNF